MGNYMEEVPPSQITW